MRKSAQGFSLIELLVTISIIAVLAAIGLVAYSGVLKQGRDSKRQSDLRSIQSVLEQYYSDQHFYPNSPAMTSYLLSGGSLTNRIGNPSSPLPVLRTYLNSLPKDPEGHTYQYYTTPPGCTNSTTASLCTSYCLYTYLENPVLVALPAACNVPIGGTFGVSAP